MKILLVNYFYYNRGGDCTYLFSLKKLLERKGHKVLVFSMQHPQNFESEYTRYFVPYINYAEEVKKINIFSGLKVFTRTIFSVEARKNLQRLIEDEKPDIAHLQNIHHHITPSIFYTLKKNKIPIVWTLHDYSVICPSTLFLNHGKVCEKCKKIRYFWPPIIKCTKDSFAASLMAAIETVIHRISGVYNLVDVFITPSEFLRNKLIEFGFKKERIICLNNFLEIDSNNGKKEEVGDYYLYVGKISEEKGLKTLISATIQENQTKLKIAGDGPLKDEMVEYVKSRDKSNLIDFLGHRSHAEVFEFLKNCKFVVMPSVWYENFPYAILEAFACGKPVIGSRIGGIPELVRDGETGLTFEPGNVSDLCSKIEYLRKNPDMIIEMGRNGRILVEQALSADEHYRKLIEIYKQASLL